MKPILFFLGLCSGYTPDFQVSQEICFHEIAAKGRDIVIENPMDDFDRAYFEWQVSQVVWI
jgi:hypothetical protein